MAQGSAFLTGQSQALLAATLGLCPLAFLKRSLVVAPAGAPHPRPASSVPSQCPTLLLPGRLLAALTPRGLSDPPLLPPEPLLELPILQTCVPCILQGLSSIFLFCPFTNVPVCPTL